MAKNGKNKDFDYDKIKVILEQVINEEEIKRKQKEEEEDEDAKYGLNLRRSDRIEKKDIKFFSSTPRYIDKKRYFVLDGNKYITYLFVRAVAKDIIFENVDFSKAYFENSYLRDCRFIRCNFEGAKFTGSNLTGSYFVDCNFDYVTFEKTFVDDEIFECAPKKSNLRYKFARSLKLNYASIGDYIRSSKAVAIELAATKRHLMDSWLYEEQWHKIKYSGIRKRLQQFWKWFKVSLLDFLWGNGESLWRLVRFNILIFFILTVYHIIEKKENIAPKILDIFFIKIPANYFAVEILDDSGKNYFEYYPSWLSLLLVITRLICFGLLMSIIIKKYNRR